MANTLNVIAAPVHGEVSPRIAKNVILDENMMGTLRRAYNVLMTRNLEIGGRPPSHDRSELPNAGGVTKSYSFKFIDGGFTTLTFSNLLLTQTIEGSEHPFPSPPSFGTDWDEYDVQHMDAAQHENYMMFTTPKKEPTILIYHPDAVDPDPYWEHVTVESLTEDTEENPAPPWHTDADWPSSVAFMIGRFVLVSRRKYYGSVAGDPLLWKVTESDDQGEPIVVPSSAFAFDVADDVDSGFHSVAAGSFVYGGSPAGVWTMSNYDNALDARNPNIKNISPSGTYPVHPAMVEGGFNYFQNDGITVKYFALLQDGFIDIEMNTYSKHFFETYRPVRIVYQRNPDKIIWILREDGKIIAFVNDEKRKFWTEIDMGDFVKDIWIARDNTKEYLYMAVERPNSTRIERFEETDPIEEEFFADDQMHMSYGSFTQNEGVIDDGNGCAVITLTAHGFNNGDILKTTNPEYPWGYADVIDADRFLIELPNTHCYPFIFEDDVKIASASNQIEITHYAGKTVDAILDGYYQEIVFDASGIAPLPAPVVLADVGIPYMYYISPRDFAEEYNMSGARTARIHPVVYDTGNILYGADVDHLTEKHLLSPDERSGIVKDLSIQGGYQRFTNFILGGRRSRFLMSVCYVEIEFGRD